MKLVAISQRVDFVAQRDERRDALDQRWHHLLERCGYMALPVPNRPDAVRALLERAEVDAIVLSGGNDLAAYGGNAPERDATDRALIDLAIERGMPLVAVCRGMQMLLHYYGGALMLVDGHAALEHPVAIAGQSVMKNSYHRYGARSSPAKLGVWATGDDGVIEGVRHAIHPMVGMMWHPERVPGFAADDVALFRETIG